MTDTNEKTSSANINTMIRRIKKAQETNNLRVHNVMVMIAEHTVAYNDCSGFARLLNNLPAGLARNASVIIDCMKEFTPIVADMKNNVFVVRLAKEGSKANKPFDIDGLKANPWFTRKEAQKDPALLSLDSIGEKILKLAEMIENKVKKEQTTGHDAELLVVANGLRVFAKRSIPDVIPSEMRPNEQSEPEQPEQPMTAEDFAPTLAAVA